VGTECFRLHFASLISSNYLGKQIFAIRDPACSQRAPLHRAEPNTVISA